MTITGALVGVVVVICVVACAGKTSSSADADGGATDGGITCQFPVGHGVPWPFAHGTGGESPSTYCADGCVPVEAVELFPSDRCKRSVLLGCIPGGGGAPEGPACTKYEADGRLISGAPGYVFDAKASWTGCSEAETQALAAAQYCEGRK